MSGMDKSTIAIMDMIAKPNRKGIVKVNADKLILHLLNLDGKLAGRNRKCEELGHTLENIQDAMTGQNEEITVLKADIEKKDKAIEVMNEERKTLEAAFQKAMGEIAGLEKIPANAQLKEYRIKIRKLEDRVRVRFENTKEFHMLIGKLDKIYEQVKDREVEVEPVEVS